MVTTRAGGINDEMTPARRGLERGDERRILILTPFSRVRADLTLSGNGRIYPHLSLTERKYLGRKTSTLPPSRKGRKRIRVRN
jgi:hypothetical protein